MQRKVAFAAAFYFAKKRPPYAKNLNLQFVTAFLTASNKQIFLTLNVVAFFASRFASSTQNTMRRHYGGGTTNEPRQGFTLGGNGKCQSAIPNPVRGSPLVATECPDDVCAALLINISSTFFFGQKKKVAKKSCLRRWHFILLKNGQRR
ncbi:MAG: hypothetical protein IJU33_00620 [Bacteroidales bacterium]|nr:hypothetical protein [Bacteroidales bacterium]